MRVVVERGDFWEFKARGAELDLEVARLRAAIAAAGMRKNALIDAFGAAHGIDAKRPFTLEDSDYTVRQGDAPPPTAAVAAPAAPRKGGRRP